MKNIELLDSLSPKQIKAVFFDAALLSLVGDISAIATVHGLTVVVAKTFKLPYAFQSNIAALSLSSALLVGVGAGFLPAVRAS